MLEIGSTWNRWEPHIHTPDTLKNNQFNGDWQGYIDAINESEPRIRAIGATEYGCLLGYRELKKRWEDGQLPDVDLIFPNVELRLSIHTEKRKPINLHLLFSPDDPDHEAQIDRILKQLTFRYQGNTYSCTEVDLIHLGRAIDPKQEESRGALKTGVSQFRVEFQQLEKLFEKELWLKKNCLVAVAAGEGDGTAGLQKDGSFAAFRQQVERFSDIIFSSKPSDRDFWLGHRKSMGSDYIEKTYGGLKPCLHGSDAHSISKVGVPDLGRMSWIKADLTFTGLRQALFEPETRVYIGSAHPPLPPAYETMSEVSVDAAPWVTTPTIKLNSGLIAIVGPKGSGKTALADMIAHGAWESTQSNSSFLAKAGSLLGTSKVKVNWGDGESDGFR